MLISVHPRVCGEQADIVQNALFGAGSSPRVRGTGHRLIPDSPGFRFIPACAGNSSAVRMKSSAETVHPRVCGEQLSRLKAITVEAVHPRVCGEQSGSLSRASPANGSSPRVRGTGVTVVAMFYPRRFIPACAGNSGDGRRANVIEPVHPRVCGEQTAQTFSSGR